MSAVASKLCELRQLWFLKVWHEWFCDGACCFEYHKPYFSYYTRLGSSVSNFIQTFGQSLIKLSLMSHSAHIGIQLDFNCCKYWQKKSKKFLVKFVFLDPLFFGIQFFFTQFYCGSETFFRPKILLNPHHFFYQKYLLR